VSTPAGNFSGKTIPLVASALVKVLASFVKGFKSMATPSTAADHIAATEKFWWPTVPVNDTGRLALTLPVTLVIDAVVERAVFCSQNKIIVLV
jgi:hypothetical protein